MNIPSIKIRAGLWLLLLTGLILAGCAPKQRAVDDSFAFGNDYENLTGPDRSTMTPEERFAYDYRSAAVARMRDEGVLSRTCTLSSAPKRPSVRRMFAAGPACRGSTVRVSCNGPIKASGFRSRVPRGNSPCWVRLLIPMKWKPEISWLSGIPGVGIIRVYTLGTANSSTAPGAARAWRSPPSAILISVRRSSAPAV